MASAPPRHTPRRPTPPRPLLRAALLCLLAGAAAHLSRPCPTVAPWEGGDLSVIEGEWTLTNGWCYKEAYVVDETSVTWSTLNYDGEYIHSTMNITAPGEFSDTDSQVTLIGAVPGEFIVFFVCARNDGANGFIDGWMKPSANITAMNEAMENLLTRLQEDEWTKDTTMMEPLLPACL